MKSFFTNVNSHDDLRKQYRILVRQLHPDRNKSKDSTDTFQAMQEQYSELLSQFKNPKNDKFIEKDEILTKIRICILEGFEPLIFYREISLFEAYSLKTININIKGRAPCETCMGSGYDYTICELCDGEGCSECDEHGIMCDSEKCKLCKGHGSYNLKRRKHKMKAIVGEHEFENYVIVIELMEGDSKKFEVINDTDLSYVANITLQDALNGCIRKVRLPNKQYFKFCVPPIVNTRDAVIECPGFGLPIDEESSERGDLIVFINIRMQF